MKKLLFIIFLAVFFACKKEYATVNKSSLELIEKSKSTQLRSEKLEKDRQRLQDSLDDIAAKQEFITTIKDDEFINIEELSDYFVLDIRYATTDNFLKKAVYTCEKCYIRGIVARALIKANEDFMNRGYRIKFFDCYRPHSVQKRMWEIYPKPGYVANPKGGSVHNRGAAIDVSLTDLQGNPLDMGTDFDHFGKEAHHSYTALSDEVIANRKILKTIMEKYGFSIIRTEWWHYNYKGGKKFKISDFRWKCE